MCETNESRMSKLGCCGEDDWGVLSPITKKFEFGKHWLNTSAVEPF